MRKWVNLFASVACVTALRPLRLSRLPARQIMESVDHDMPEALSKHINAWCGVHGLMYTDGKLNWTPAPISLVPSAFSKSAFEYAKTAQPVWNKLMDRIARDRAFLKKELDTVCEADDFTKRVMKIYDTISDDIVVKGLQFGIFRSDYMLNHDNRLLQVEINTIAASFGCLSKKVRSLHDHLLARYGGDRDFARLLEQVTTADAQTLRAGLEPNLSMDNLAAALAIAHRAADKGDESIVLFIVQPGERNQGDQRALEAQLFEAHGVKVEFVTLADAATACHVQPDQSLVLHGAPVSVVYYRAGYAPTDYPTELEWSARTLLEHSTAIKCPNAGYHLAGTKAVQAALCKPGVLERFLTADECALLRQCFAQQYSLGDEEVRAAARAALVAATKDGSAWVLKPQREGGGNNFYNEQLSAFVREHLDDPALSGYVLMQRIFPQQAATAFYRQGKAVVGSSISEVGVYGTYLARPDEEPILNEYCGYLLRTKGSGVDEGGVATGYSVLNSITLTTP